MTLDDEATELCRRTRAAQGLPPTVEDDALLAAGAALWAFVFPDPPS